VVVAERVAASAAAASVEGLCRQLEQQVSFCFLSYATMALFLNPLP
jgi:hypothetical protein